MGKPGFDEPLVRCDSCNTLVFVGFLHQNGMCHYCGNRRFRNVLSIREDEMKAIKEGTMDFGTEVPKALMDLFLGLFEEVGNAKAAG